MNELKVMLEGIQDSYYDFISYMLHFASKDEKNLSALKNYISAHENALTSDVIEFVLQYEEDAVAC